jgi:hypothetical protein
MPIKTLVIAGAAVLAAVPFSPHVVLAQSNTYVAPDEGQSSDDQSSQEMKKQRRHGQSSDDQSSQEMKKHRMEGQSNDEQTSRDMKKRHIESQTSDEQSSREMRRDGREAMDRDRHGERMRHREGRFRYFHEGYYYATPWWTVGVAVDGGIGCREGARMVFRHGFNRVVPIDCGGDFYTYRGWRGGEPWRIRIDADTGRIVAARPAG